VDTERGFIDRTGGVSLFFTAAVPDQHTGPIVILVHGFGEHCGRYDHVVTQLAEAGIGVLRFDYRGHGQASGKRGHVMSFDDYLGDLDGAISLVRRRWPDAPRFILGHSQGGLITLLYLAERGGDQVGAVVTSPFLGFAIKVPAWKALAGRGLSRLIPGFSMPTGLDAGVLCHIPAVVEAYTSDPLVHTVATSRWFTEAERAHERVLHGAAQIESPLLVLQAGDDQLVDPAATEAVFEKVGSGDKEYHRYDGLYHEILNESEGPAIVERIAGWIAARTPDPASS